MMLLCKLIEMRLQNGEVRTSLPSTGFKHLGTVILSSRLREDTHSDQHATSSAHIGTYQYSRLNASLAA